jgi:hypothetical protein
VAESPGGVEVGRVSIRVVPDTSKFREELKTQLDKAISGIKLKIPVGVDTSGVKAELEKIKKEADGKKAKLDVEVDGDGVVRETRRIKNLAQKLVGAIKMTVGLNVPGSVTRIKAEMKIIKNVVEGYKLRIPMEFVGLSKWLGILGAVSAILLTIPHLIGAIGGAVNVVGGLLATLPALAAAAAFGIGALVVGLHGFGSALSASGDPAKFEEALKKLTPAAQESARALAEFRQPLSDIRKAVQEALFKGMADSFLDLKGLLPPIKAGLVGSAAGIREMTKAWIAMATSQRSIEDTGTIGRNVSKMFDQMRPAAANFGQAMRDITVVGSTFLPRLGTAVSEITGKFAAWAEKARETGRLDQIIQNAIDKVKQLGRIVADVTVGFRNIFQSMSGGKDFLDILERITQNFREWSAAKDTQATLARLADVMRVVSQAAWELFSQVFKSAGAILKDLEPFLLTFARGLGGVVLGAVKAITPPLQAMARWLSENRAVMVPLILTIAAMVTAFKLAVTAANAIVALRDSILALKAASSIIGELTTNIVGNLKTMIGAIASTTAKMWAETGRWLTRWATVAAGATAEAARTSAAWIASASKSAAFTARYYAIMVADALKSWGKMTIAAVANAAKILAAWIASLARMVAVTVAQMAVTVAGWVASWVAMAAAAVANAIVIAGAWLLAMAPIALVIAAIIALVALIVLNWDTIKNATVTTWNAVWKFVSDVITWIVDKFSDIGDGIKAVIQWFVDMGNGMVTGIRRGLDWLRGIKDAILGFFKDAGSWLYNVGKSLVDGMKRGWQAAWPAFQKAAIDQGNSLVDNLKGLWGIHSPSRVMKGLGENLVQGLTIGLESQSRAVGDAARTLADTVTSGFGTPDLGIDASWSDGIVEGSVPALAALDRIKASVSDVSASWSAQLTTEDIKPMREEILDALGSGLVVEIDGQKVTKSVNRNNRDMKRRGQ